jgi:hypothetical protein
MPHEYKRALGETRRETVPRTAEKVGA